MTTSLLTWTHQYEDTQEAHLGTKEDGVTFELSYMPTCYRRGPYRLLIEVCSGPNHLHWGCFDAQDQPMRWYHNEANAKSEAELLARVLHRDRHKTQDTPERTRIGKELEKLKKEFREKLSHTETDIKP